MKNSVISITVNRVDITLDSPVESGSTNCAMVEPRCRSISSPATSAAQNGMPNNSPIRMPIKNSLISNPAMNTLPCSGIAVSASNTGKNIGMEMATATQPRIIPVRPRRLKAGVITTTPMARQAASEAALITG